MCLGELKRFMVQKEVFQLFHLPAFGNVALESFQFFYFES